MKRILLTGIFVTLKLTHTVDWSWWWITAPLWGGYAILVAIFVLAGFYTASRS